MDNVRLISLLQAIPLFADLEDGELMDVLRIAKPVQHEPGHVICRQGDPGECMYVIQSGEVTINIKGADGRPIPVATLKPGDLLGEPDMDGGAALAVGGAQTVEAVFL